MSWIPIEEAVPDTDDTVILSFANLDRTVPGICKKDPDGGAKFYVYNIMIEDYVPTLQMDLFVNAWMPLPDPYREDG